MPSLNLLWRNLLSQKESQNKLRVLCERSLLTSKPKTHCNNNQGGYPSSCDYTFSGPFIQSSKVGDPGKPLSARQAASRVFATLSVHSPVWQNFSYNPCPALIDKNQAARSKPPLGCMLSTSSPNYRITNVRISIPAARLHALPSISQNSLLTLYPNRQLSFSSNIDGGDNVSLCETFTRRLTLSLIGPVNPRPSWTCHLQDSDHGLFSSFWNNLRSHELQHLLSRTVEFHLLQLGPWLLPAMRDFLSKASYGFTCGAAAFMHLGLTYDCSADSEGSDLGGKQGERSLDNKGLKLLSAACYLPHPDKAETGGEDAFFICPEKQVVGVADGVGGWADVGVDAGEYARQLMSQSLLAVKQEPAGFVDTAHIMQIAHSKTTCRGSSTACILALSENGLQATNLGDSGFLVVRNGRLVFKSPPQQHNFNVPFQLESGGGDPPGAAEVFTVEVAVGDVIVAGTDGLFDNLYDTEVVSIVVQSTRSGATPDTTARKIASLARERAADCNRQTPFATAAQDAGFRFYGGKMDDITVVVSYVVK